MLAWLAAHWLMLAGGGVGVLAFLFPAVSVPVLRFLVTTERGRYLLLAAIAVTTFRLHGNLRYDAGHSDAMAEQARAANRQKVDVALATLDAYMAGAKAQQAIGDQLDAAHEANDRARDRLVADLRAGNLRLREHWRCDGPAATPATASGPARDEGAERRQEGAGDLVRVADNADADLAACQAQVTKYQQIGVLRVDPHAQ